MKLAVKFFATTCYKIRSLECTFRKRAYSFKRLKIELFSRNQIVLQYFLPENATIQSYNGHQSYCTECNPILYSFVREHERINMKNERAPNFSVANFSFSYLLCGMDSSFAHCLG